MRVYLTILLMCLLLTACSRKKGEAPPQTVAAATPTSAVPAAPAAALSPDEEPPEQVLRELMFRQYAVLEANRGIPVTVSASGKSGVLRSKLYEVRKDQCRHDPVDPPGMYECGVDLMVSMWWDGREPGEPSADSKRISVIRDANDVWIDCTYSQEKTGICITGLKR